MNIVQAFCSTVALAAAGAAWAGPFPDTMESGFGFKSVDLPAVQTGSFELSFDAMPLADRIDVFTGLSSATAGSAAEVSAIVRFNDSGKIDVRNAGAFKADQSVGYSANKVYRFRMVVDVASKTYSVFVTPPGQAEVSLASNYAFRTQRVAVSSLSKLVLAGFKSPDGFFNAPHRVTGIALKPL